MFKSVSKLILSSLAACFALALSAQTMAINPEYVKVEKMFVKAPNFEGSTGYGSLPNQNGAPKWMLILVTYTPDILNAKMVEKAVKNETPAKKDKRIQGKYWEKELTVDAFALIPAGEEYMQETKNALILTTGRQVLWSVVADGRKHRVLFAIPPNIFSQFSYSKVLEEAKKSAQSDAEAIPVAIFFRNTNGQLICQVFTGSKNLATNKKITSDSVEKLFLSVLGQKDEYITLDGGILPKERTPWQWLDVGNFDLPKNLIDGGNNGK